MFYVMKQRSLIANTPEGCTYDRLGRFKTYDEALEYLKRNKQGAAPTFILEEKAIANYESIWDYVGGKVIEY